MIPAAWHGRQWDGARERAGCTPTLGAVGPGHWARVTQGESLRVTHGPGHCSQCLWPGGTPRAPGILELAALRGAVVNFIGLFCGPGSGLLVNRSTTLPWKEFGSCSPGLEEPLPCTE